MKVSVQPLTAAVPIEKSSLAVWSDLIKARLTLLVILTALAGFSIGSRGPLDLGAMLHTMLGTALLASGAAALNQLLERNLDARMQRTQDRPLPSGRLQPATALAFGLLASILGTVELTVALNPLTGALGLLTLLIYLFVYTPLKRVTTLNTAVGAIPGAFPPLIGWAAARGEIGWAGWTLFALQFFWQLPHFLAIAWLYRDDYARAGFKMLPVFDPAGQRTGRQAAGHALGLLLVSVSPFLLGIAGPVYLAGALGLGTLFVTCAFRFLARPDQPRARALFLASIVYLPLVLGLIVWDKPR